MGRGIKATFSAAPTIPTSEQAHPLNWPGLQLPGPVLTWPFLVATTVYTSGSSSSWRNSAAGRRGGAADAPAGTKDNNRKLCTVPGPSTSSFQGFQSLEKGAVTAHHSSRPEPVGHTADSSQPSSDLGLMPPQALLIVLASCPS